MPSIENPVTDINGDLEQILEISNYATSDEGSTNNSSIKIKEIHLPNNHKYSMITFEENDLKEKSFDQ